MGAPLQALIFDSWYDAYKGVIVLVRVVQGTVRKGSKVRLIATAKDFEVISVGANAPFPRELDALSVGEVGFVVVDTWQVKPDKKAEIAVALDEIRQQFLTFPGIVSIDFAHIDNDPRRYLVVFRYTDAAAREAFVNTDDLKGAMARLRDLWDFAGTSYQAMTMRRGE